MRFVFGLGLLTLLLVSPALVGGDRAPAFTSVAPPTLNSSIVLDAKIVCGDFGQGYTCRRESGAIRRGKMQKIPSAGPKDGAGNSGGWGWFGGSEDENPLPSPESGPGTSGSGTAASSGCPPNSERLGGHCIPYTQTCRQGLAGNAPPQACQRAEEKLVCNARADGLKDCCCRTYSKF